MPNSKKKGNKWERVVCHVMKEWTGYEFSRVPQSGGLRWKNRDEIVSDVICTDEKHGRRFTLAIECKSYQEIKFEHVLLGNEGAKILHFWNQVNEDAKATKKIPMLVMRYNNMPKEEAFVVLEKSFFNHFLENNSYFNKFSHPIMAIRLNSNEAFYIFMLSDLKSIDYQEFHKIARKYLKTLYPKE